MSLFKRTHYLVRTRQHFHGNAVAQWEGQAFKKTAIFLETELVYIDSIKCEFHT